MRFISVKGQNLGTKSGLTGKEACANIRKQSEGILREGLSHSRVGQEILPNQRRKKVFKILLKVNGPPHPVDVTASDTLARVLREELGVEDHDRKFMNLDG